MGTGNNTHLISITSPSKDNIEFRTLDPSRAAWIRLPPNLPDLEHTGDTSTKWPDGFWKLFDAACSHHKSKRFRQAKEAYETARSLRKGYKPLDTALLWIYRQLYKTEIDRKHWDKAYQELSDLLKSLPDSVSNTDKRQYNKVVEAIRKNNPDFSAQLISLGETRKRAPANVPPTIDSSPGTTFVMELGKTFRRAKDDKLFFRHHSHVTTNGFIATCQVRDTLAGAYLFSCRIRMYSPQGDFISERVLSDRFHTLEVSSVGTFLIGCTQDLQLCLWSIAGTKCAERNITQEANGNMYRIRSVSLSADAKYCLYTSGARAHLVDNSLRLINGWIMPPPPPPKGYTVEHKGSPAIAEPILKALATLELTGRPTQKEITSQFRRLILRYHPDRNPGDPVSLERTIAIIEAYDILSDEDVGSTLKSMGVEGYYEVLYEVPIKIPNHNISSMFSISCSPSVSDWVEASHIASHTERIYLGCYSGRVYCLDVNGTVQRVYSTNAPIKGILEKKEYLYIWTHNSLYVIQDNRISNIIDIREATIESFPDWGIIVHKGRSLIIYSETGSLLGQMCFSSYPREVIPTPSGFVAHLTKYHYRISLSLPSIASSSTT